VSAAAGKLRVLLTIPALEDLGVQHDIRALLNHWNRDKFHVALLVHKREGAFADQFRPDEEMIEVDRLIPDVRGARVLLRVLGYARAFRQFKPHAVISFVPYTNLASMYARPLSGQKFGLVVSEHAHVTASMLDAEAFHGAFLWFYRRRFSALYNHSADKVKCIAEESRRDLVDHHGILDAQTCLIHNPVEIEEVQHLGKEPAGHPWFEEAARAQVPLIVNVGRLAAQKRQDVLLEAFAQVRKTRPARLAFVGRGPWLERLEEQARRLGVAQDVVFLGFQRNPWRFMAKAAVLALSSDWEGLPCVLTEAMALRTPVVSARCPSGPSEMLLEGKGGLLVPCRDPAALAAGILDVLENPATAAARVETAYQALDRFRPERVTPQYEALAEEVARKAGVWP
jgi:glycosyltransferase involved in cell wall biosynthesis